MQNRQNVNKWDLNDDDIYIKLFATSKGDHIAEASKMVY